MNEIIDISNRVKEILGVLGGLETEIAEINRKRNKIDKDISKVASMVDETLQGFADGEKLKNFFKKPYVIIPQSNKKVFVVVPKFVKNFSVGWLYKEEENFFIYQLDQYSKWLGDVPEEMLEQIDFTQEFEANVVDNFVYYTEDQKANVKKAIGKHLANMGDTSARIIKGHEFDIIVEMIQKGNLPFRPSKVADGDRRLRRSKIEPRGYQKPALNKFWETGAVGLFHPTGSGKSMVASLIMDELIGDKIIFVPTNTIREQWEYYIEEYLSFAKNEIEISTYAGYRASDKRYILTVFDECQYLPANTFSRLSTLNTKYRIGLSASPHREDNRESYIFALTGFPIGLNWQQYMAEAKKSYHQVNVYIVNTPEQKIKKVLELVNPNKKTLIFSDSLPLGNKISTALSVPFIYGETDDRYNTFMENKVVVGSRVMDMGISDKILEHIIEVDFLYGSRQQEIQRTGRLMHSDAVNKRHDIIFTRKEFEDYNKRLWSLQEKGFTIKIFE